MTLKDLSASVFRTLRCAGAGSDRAAGPSVIVGGRVPKAQDELGVDSFTAMIGAEAIREMLKALDPEDGSRSASNGIEIRTRPRSSAFSS
jgi:DNA-directed RNA polymerase subunit beta'